jgi:hypothetical protein
MSAARKRNQQPGAANLLSQHVGTVHKAVKDRDPLLMVITQLGAV